MSSNIYHIKIKKEYASAILEDLQQIDAIEMVEESLQEWQQRESIKRLQQMKDHPESVLSEDAFFRALNDDAE